jgi:ABC-2 type transport system ATP-binding protein
MDWKFSGDRPCFQKSKRVRELMDWYADFFSDFDRQRASEMLRELQIDPEQKFKALSKGTQEKVQLVLTMSRRAKLYLLDEPIGGVDPATRDYILSTIIGNYDPEATVLISTHLIADVEQVLDEVVFISQGQVVLQKSVDEIREEQGKSVDQLFREVFRC